MAYWERHPEAVFWAVAVSFILYFLPATTASERRHSKADAIFVLNLLLGWSALGWVVAFVWVFTEKKKERPGIPANPPGGHAAVVVEDEPGSKWEKRLGIISVGLILIACVFQFARVWTVYKPGWGWMILWAYLLLFLPVIFAGTLVVSAYFAWASRGWFGRVREFESAGRELNWHHFQDYVGKRAPEKKVRFWFGVMVRGEVASEAREFLRKNGPTWDHQGWVRFLANVRKRVPESALSASKIGEILEEVKRDWEPVSA